MKSAIVLTLSAVLAILIAGPLQAARLEVGVATVDIAPDEGKVFDPLAAKAIVFRQGGEAAAMVVCDVIVISEEVSREARTAAFEKTGIPYENITISATHTHSSAIREDLAPKIAEAIVEANASLAPAAIRSGAAHRDDVSFNRRFLMKDGTVRFNPSLDEEGRSFDGGHPFEHPDIVRPVGPIDPEVNFIMVERDGAPVASLTAFALHVCTCGSARYSSDYPHFLQLRLQQEYGPRFLSIFAAGACGDINNWDYTKPGPQTGRMEASKPIGDRLGSAVIGAAAAIDTPVEPSLAVRRRMIQIPVQKYSEMDLEWALEAREKDFPEFEGTGYDQRGFLAGVRARKIVRLADLHRRGGKLPVEIHAIRLSRDTAIVTMPGEIFVEFGLALKEASPFANTFVVELANGRAMSYVPTEKAFSEGGYEVVNSMLIPQAGDMMIDTGLELLKELKLDLP